MNVLVAMSGGVDSSVAAALLQEGGHRVIGVTLKLLKTETGMGCCGSSREIDDARSVCASLGVPHYVMDFSREFQSHIMDPFLAAYVGGETPNPCIACNRFVKFDALLKKAVALGADAVATGHYARIESRTENNGVVRYLRRGADSNKDQSYVLYHLGQQELERLVFPVGDLTKPQVRDAARRFRLNVADKDESMEICFVPRADTAAYVRFRAAEEGRTSPSLSAGPIKTLDGKTVGQHRGVAFYTRGQRNGLGVSLGRPLYVVDIDAQSNTLWVGDDADTLSSSAEVRAAVWTAGSGPARPVRVSVQVRSRPAAAMATVEAMDTGAVIRFDEPQRAVTPGQAAVFYEDDRVVGGGTLCRFVPSGVKA